MTPQSLTTKAIAHIDELIDVVKPSQYLVDGFVCLSEPQDCYLKRCLDKREPLSDVEDPEEHVIQKNALIGFIAMDFYGHLPVSHSKVHMAAIAVDLGWNSSERLRRILDYYAGNRLTYLGKVESRYIPVSASTLSRKLCHFVDQYRLRRVQSGTMSRSLKKEFNNMRQIWQKAYRETPRAFLEGDLDLPVVLKSQMPDDQWRNREVACATPAVLRSNKPMLEGVTKAQDDEESLLRKDLAAALQKSPEAPLNRRRSLLPVPRRNSRALVHGTTPLAITNTATATLSYDSYQPTPDFVHPARRVMMKQGEHPGKAQEHGKGAQHPPPPALKDPSGKIILKARTQAEQRESQHNPSQSASKDKPHLLPKLKLKVKSRDGQDAHTAPAPGNTKGGQGQSGLRQVSYTAELDNVRVDQEAVATLLARFERRRIGYEASRRLPADINQSVHRIVEHQKKVKQELEYLRGRLAAQL